MQCGVFGFFAALKHLNVFYHFSSFQYPIKNRSLLVKAGLVLVFIIAMFFLQSIPGYDKLSIAWCALIGVMFLLIIAEK